MLRPWMEGKHLYESLLDGRLGLEDIALMNDALDIRDENTRRMNERTVASVTADVGTTSRPRLHRGW